MLKTLFVAVVLAVVASTAANAKTLKFETYEPGDHRPIFMGDWHIDQMSTKADLTAGAKPDAPLVVYNPGWGGTDQYESAFKDIRKQLGDGYTHLVLQQSDKADLAGRTVTIYEAIRAAEAAGVKPSKLFLIGASGGGQEAIQATQTKVSAALGGGRISISGVVAFYPSCRVSFDDKSFLGVPILIFTGLKDEVAPAKLCRELRDSGGLSHAKIVEFPDAGHSWLFTGKAETKSQRTWGDCKIRIDSNGLWLGEGSDSKDGIGPFLDHMSKKCSKNKNMRVGRDENVYSSSVSQAVEFIKSHN